MEELAGDHIKMGKMKKFAILFIAILIICDLSAQINKFGIPLIKNYSRQVTQGSEQNWWITKDKAGAVYFGNDDKGVIRFDGSNWTNIPVRNNPRVRALGADSDGIIYVGCAYEFGYIEPGIKGELNYISLSQRYDSKTGNTTKQSENSEVKPENTEKDVYIGEITCLVVKDSSVYFLSNQSLFIYNRYTDSLKYINLLGLPEVRFKSFIRIYAIDDRIIMAENNKGLYEYKDGKIELLPGGDFFKMKVCITILPVSKGKVLVGTYGNGIFLYDYITGSVDDKWVDKSVNQRISKIYCGAKLPSGEYVLGTAGSGIYILDDHGKLAGYWNNEKTDLQDDFIYALYVDPDKDSELWIATLGYISKAYTNIPITKFGEKSGINGGVNGICEINGTLYLSTDDGVVKSKVDKDGCLIFEKVGGIQDQVFPIYHASIASENFIMAGSIKGLYQITLDGRVINFQGCDEI